MWEEGGREKMWPFLRVGGGGLLASCKAAERPKRKGEFMLKKAALILSLIFAGVPPFF